MLAQTVAVAAPAVMMLESGVLKSATSARSDDGRVAVVLTTAEPIDAG
jgi:hypothetical protein